MLRRKTLVYAAGLLASLLVAFWAGRFWLKPFMIYGHSAFVDYLRQYCFDLAVRDGVLYPRWLDEFYFGYGSPIFNFYAPLFYIFSELFRLFGASVLYSLKFARLAMFFVAGAGMYIFARIYCREFGAWVASVLYVLSNYFLLNSYVRVSSAELLALALSPYLLLTLVHLFREPTFRRMAALSLVLAMLVVSHNISALLWSATVLGFGLWAVLWSRRLKYLWWTLAGFVLAIALSAFFWVPAFSERDLTHSEESLTHGYFDYRKHFVHFDQVWADEWGYGISREGRADTMPVSCGRIVLLAWIAGVGVILILGYSKTDDRREGWFFALWSFVGLFMVLPTSRWIWGILPLVKYVQFPWRFYLLFTPLAVAAFAVGLSFVRQRDRYLAAIMAAMVALGLLVWQIPRARGYRVMLDSDAQKIVKVDTDEVNIPPNLVDPHDYFDRSTILANGVTTTAKDDYLPIWVKQRPAGLPQRAFEVEGDADVTLLEERHNRRKFLVDSKGGASLVLNLFYFPGWEAVGKDGELRVGYEENSGRLVVALDPGVYELEVHFGSTLMRLAGWAFSACALVFSLLALIYGSKRRSSDGAAG